MKGLLSRKDWEGPVSIARIVTAVAAMWLIVLAVTGLTAGKAVLPLSLMMLGLGFLGGYQMGQSKRS